MKRPALCDVPGTHLHWLYHNDPRYHRLWGGTLTLPPSKGRPHQPQKPQAGPGTELKRLLAELGVNAKFGCGCESRAHEMNLLGVDGCRERREEVADWIKEAATKASWAEIYKAAAAMRREDWCRFYEPFLSLVDEAIRRAEKLLPYKSDG